MAINTLFKNIADAIRAKTGSAGTYTPAQMGDAIRGIPTVSDVLFSDNAYSTSGSFSYNKSITVPDNDNYTVYVQMFVNSTHTVKINGANVPLTSQYSSLYAYLWNFAQDLSAGDTIEIAASSSGSPMVTVVIKRTNDVTAAAV